MYSLQLLLRFNERDSGRAVSLLVGFPFLFTNIGLRLIGFSFLFCYYDKVWLFLCLGLLFWICALSVLVSSMERMCGRLRRALGDNSSNSSLSQKTTLMDGTAGMLLLSLGNMFVPCGYATNSRGWRMLFVSWLGKRHNDILTWPWNPCESNKKIQIQLFSVGVKNVFPF